MDEIIDQVIDILPEDNNEIFYSDDVGNILNMLESNNKDPESAKINAIQKELMAFDNVYNNSPIVVHRTTTTTTQIRYNNATTNNNQQAINNQKYIV